MRCRAALGTFNSLNAPAVFTPEQRLDDCDRPSNGGFNSLERLGHERATLFSTPFAGEHRIRKYDGAALPAQRSRGMCRESPLDDRPGDVRHAQR